MAKSKPRMRHSGIGASMIGNNESWYYYVERLTELAISLFEWKGLPKTVDERFLELTLFKNGNAVFFRDEVLGFLALQCMPNSKLNIYGIPEQRRAYAVNGYQCTLSSDNSVLIYNNRMHTNSVAIVNYYARRLWDLDRTIDVNCRAMKTPILLQCDENKRLTLENMYMQYDGNKPLIVADKGLDVAGAIKVLKMDTPYVADRLYEYKTKLWNEALTALGIANVGYEKKERMVSDEVMRSLGGVVASRYSRLTMRQQAADEINSKFGLNVSVNFRDGDGEGEAVRPENTGEEAVEDE